MAILPELSRTNTRRAYTPFACALLLASSACAAESLTQDEADDASRRVLATAATATDAPGACVPGRDATCNGNAADDWFAGRCQPDATCLCATGSVVDAATGKCVGAQWPEGSMTRGVAAAAGSSEAALVTLDQVSSSEPQVASLRWIDGDGIAIGAPLRLAADASEVAIASDGTRYVACWTRAPRVACASVQRGDAEARPLFSAEGRAPGVAFSGGTWLIAYMEESDERARTQLVAFHADGSRSTLGPLVETARAARSLPMVAARPDGFVVVAGDPMSVYTLDAALSVGGAPVSLGASVWSYGAVAATRKQIAVSIARPYGAVLYLVDPTTGAVANRPLAGGGKIGLPVALRAENDALWATWSDTSWHDALVDVAASAEPFMYGGYTPFASYALNGQLFVATAPYAGARILRRP